MDTILTFLSRKFLITILFSSGLPILFHQLGISDNVCLAALGLCASYMAANVFDKTGGP